MKASSRSERPAVLLFDLGGVLLENVAFDALNALLPAPMPVEDLKTRWLASPAVRRFEVGGCSPDEFAAAVVAEWQLPLAPEAFLEAFAAWPKGLYPGAAQLLRELRASCRVACLSNSNPVHWERFGGFSEHFDVPLSSHLLGEVKPDAACFQKALKACGADAPDVAFFDDALVNVAAARALGIRTFHVNGLQELRSALAAQGWLR